jgi:hypothetical protein
MVAKFVVVGINPSSSVSTPWSDFWHPKTGFNMGAFQQQRCIEVQRQNTKLHLRQKRQKCISPTRKRIYQLVKEIRLKGTFVNTNIFWADSPRAKLLDRQFKIQAPVAWLLRRIPLDAVIVVHGKDAKAVYRKLRLPHRNPGTVIFTPHLAFISRKAFKALKTKVIRRISATHFKSMGLSYRKTDLRRRVVRVPGIRSCRRLATTRSGNRN